MQVDAQDITRKIEKIILTSSIIKLIIHNDDNIFDSKMYDAITRRDQVVINKGVNNQY